MTQNKFIIDFLNDIEFTQFKKVEEELVRISVQNPISLPALWELFREKIKIHSAVETLRLIEGEVKIK